MMGARHAFISDRTLRSYVAEQRRDPATDQPPPELSPTESRLSSPISRSLPRTAIVIAAISLPTWHIVTLLNKSPTSYGRVTLARRRLGMSSLLYCQTRCTTSLTR